MKETKQERHYNQLLTLYGKRPSLKKEGSKKKVQVGYAAPEHALNKDIVIKNLLLSSAIAGLLIVLQYVLGKTL